MNLFNNKIIRAIRTTALMLLASFLLVSCGGGGGGTTSGNSAPGANEVIISGRAAKGTILNATVRATQIINGQLGGTSKDVTLGSNGDFSVSMPKGLVHLQVIPNTNSTTQDEAIGVAVALPPEFRFRAAADLTDLTATAVSINITPFSEIGVALTEKSGGLTAANINKANSGIANILGFDHLGTTPIQSNDTVGLTSATVSEKKLSVLNAAVSNMAATDALSCGVQATYGQTINCTVAKLAEQFQMNNATTVLPLATGVIQSTTANSTPMVLLGDTGYQSLLGGIANAVGSGAMALAKTTVDLVQNGIARGVSTATYVKATASNAINDTKRQAAWLDYQASLVGKDYLVDGVTLAYKYAVLSDLVYKASPTFGPESIWTNGNHPDEPLSPLNDRSGVYSVKDSYTVLNWKTYGIDPNVSNSVGLQWGIFFNNEEIVFVYRGTEPLSLNDWLSNLNDLTCLNPQYETAKVQFDALVSSPKFIKDFLTAPNKRRVVLTGHSLGGGVASYINTWSNNTSIIDQTFGFNSAPLCSARALAVGANAFINDWKMHRIVINGEPVSALCNLAFVYCSGESPIPYPNPYVVSILNPIDSHSMGSILFALDAAKGLCTPTLCPPPQSQTQVISPSLTTPLVVSGIQSSYSIGITPYRPAIALSGSSLSTINQISWACTQPNGTSCAGSPYVWTPNSWSGKVDIFNDTSIKVYPTLLASGDAAGTYNWTATFSALNSPPVSIPFTVTYQPQAATGIAVDSLSSAMFTSGTTTISTTTNPVVAALTVVGKNLSTVSRIEWRWSGATTGSKTWLNTDSTWSSKVAYTPDGKLALSPTVVEANPTWSGTAIWTGTLMDAAGASQNITFSVLYQSATPPTTCTPPQVLTNGVCTTPPNTVGAPTAFTLTATTQCSGTSPQIVLSGWGSSGFTTFDLYRDGSLYSPANTGPSFLNSSVIAGATYTYSVNAKNASGSTSSNTISVTAPTTCGGTVTPVAPSGLAALAASNFMSLAWNDNSSNETGFNVERKTGMSGSWSQIASVGQNIGAYLDYGVSAGVTYYYRVSAYNASGSSAYTNEASVTIAVVTTPTVQSLAATLITSTTAQMNGTINPNGLSTSAYFEYGTTTGYGGTTGPGTFSGTSAVAIQSGWSGLTPNTTYH